MMGRSSFWDENKQGGGGGGARAIRKNELLDPTDPRGTDELRFEGRCVRTVRERDVCVFSVPTRRPTCPDVTCPDDVMID